MSTDPRAGELYEKAFALWPEDMQTAIKVLRLELDHVTLADARARWSAAPDNIRLAIMLASLDELLYHQCLATAAAEAEADEYADELESIRSDAIDRLTLDGD